MLFQAIKSDDLKTVKKETQQLAGYELSFADSGTEADTTPLPDNSVAKAEDLNPIALSVIFSAKETFKHLA